MKKSTQPRNVAQCKTPVSAQSSKRPVAPPVYRPQSAPKVLQRKSRVYRPQANPPRPVLSRSQAVQRSLGGLPPEFTQQIGRYLDPQSLSNLRLASQKQEEDLDRHFRSRNFDGWLVPGNLESVYRVHQDNYEAICNYVVKEFGLTMMDLRWLIFAGIGEISELFWNAMRKRLGRSQLHALLMDQDFTELFGQVRF